MQYNELLNRLQNLMEFKPKTNDLAAILGIPVRTLYTRAQRNSEFSLDELKKLEEHYGINLLEGINADCVEIEHIRINPSCGKGTIVLDEAEITPVKLGKAIISSILKVSKPEYLKTFKASGDSMEPIIEDGDILLVDTNRTDYQNGGVFLITINNDWYVKRLRKRLSGELDIISDNGKYPMETFTPETQIDVFIKGRVIKNLSRGL